MRYTSNDMSALIHHTKDTWRHADGPRTGKAMLLSIMCAPGVYSSFSFVRWFRAGFAQVYANFDTGDPRYKMPEELRRFIEWFNAQSKEMQAKVVKNGAPLRDPHGGFHLGRLHDKTPGPKASWTQKPEGRALFKKAMSCLVTDTDPTDTTHLLHTEGLSPLLPSDLPHRCEAVFHGIWCGDEAIPLKDMLG